MEEEWTFLKNLNRCWNQGPRYEALAHACWQNVSLETKKGLTVRFFWVYFCVVLSMEPRALYVLSKDSTTALYPQANKLINQLLNFLGISSHLFLMQTKQRSQCLPPAGITAGEELLQEEKCKLSQLPWRGEDQVCGQGDSWKIFNPLSPSIFPLPYPPKLTPLIPA